jgi:hypothetical protein
LQNWGIKMKFSNWFKIIWWLVILSTIGFLLYQRYADISSGKGNSIDVFIIFIWVALALSPIFQEISLPGITLKQQLEELKKDVKQELFNMRTAIENSVNVRTQVNSYYPPPPPDNQLPALEEKIKIAVANALEQNGLELKRDGLEILKVDEDTLFLFSARHSLEKEIRRIWNERIEEENINQRRPLSSYFLVQSIVQAELISPQFGHLIREVFSVCSPAIHGEEISEAKVRFVKDVVPELISVLRAI